MVHLRVLAFTIVATVNKSPSANKKGQINYLPKRKDTYLVQSAVGRQDTVSVEFYLLGKRGRREVATRPAEKRKGRKNP